MKRSPKILLKQIGQITFQSCTATMDSHKQQVFEYCKEIILNVLDVIKVEGVDVPDELIRRVTLMKLLKKREPAWKDPRSNSMRCESYNKSGTKCMRSTIRGFYCSLHDALGGDQYGPNLIRTDPSMRDYAHSLGVFQQGEQVHWDRCKGFTKIGNMCRKIPSGNGFCHIHNPDKETPDPNGVSNRRMIHPHGSVENGDNTLPDGTLIPVKEKLSPSQVCHSVARSIFRQVSFLMKNKEEKIIQDEEERITRDEKIARVKESRDLTNLKEITPETPGFAVNRMIFIDAKLDLEVIGEKTIKQGMALGKSLFVDDPPWNIYKSYGFDQTHAMNPRYLDIEYLVCTQGLRPVGKTILRRHLKALLAMCPRLADIAEPLLTEKPKPTKELLSTEQPKPVEPPSPVEDDYWLTEGLRPVDEHWFTSDDENWPPVELMPKEDERWLPGTLWHPEEHWFISDDENWPPMGPDPEEEYWFQHGEAPLPEEPTLVKDEPLPTKKPSLAEEISELTFVEEGVDMTKSTESVQDLLRPGQRVFTIFARYGCGFRKTDMKYLDNIDIKKLDSKYKVYNKSGKVVEESTLRHYIPKIFALHPHLEMVIDLSLPEEQEVPNNDGNRPGESDAARLIRNYFEDAGIF